MKILFIGNYRDSSSLGRVSRDYLLSLLEAGADIVARPILISYPSIKSLDTRILKAETKSSNGAAICVQHLPTTHLLSDARFDKNIVITGFNYSPKHSQNAEILQKLSTFDDNIFLNSFTLARLGEVGGAIYNHPVKLTESKERLSLPKDKFIFYFIGKLSQRKNLDALVTAFHREFGRDEPVELMIKTSCDIDKQQALQVIDAHLNTLKQKAGKYKNIEKYKREFIVLNDTIDENWDIVHNTGNCLVMSSYGEYTSLIPNLALAHGNQVIANNTIGLWDTPQCKNLTFCDSMQIITDDSRSNNLTNFDTPKNGGWYEISIARLQMAMRAVYTSPIQEKVQMPSFAEVGQQLLNRILN